MLHRKRAECRGSVVRRLIDGDAADGLDFGEVVDDALDAHRLTFTLINDETTKLCDAALHLDVNGAPRRPALLSQTGEYATASLRVGDDARVRLGQHRIQGTNQVSAADNADQSPLLDYRNPLDAPLSLQAQFAVRCLVAEI